MRIPRFYEPYPLETGDIIDLSPETHRHAIQVLRMRQHDSLILFDGHSGEYHARLTHVDKRKSQAEIIRFDSISRESKLNTQLSIAIIKPDKMDFAIQKAVELGVNSIQPLVTHRSVIRLNDKRIDKKMQHWQGVIIAACEQSGRTLLPILHMPIALPSHLESDSEKLKLALLPGDHPTLMQISQPQQAIDIIIGPEGGYTNDEIDLLASHCQAVSLGALIQRAETASTSTLAVIQQLWQNA